MADRTARVAFAWIALLTAALYAPLLHGPFVFEDPHIFTAAVAWSVPGRALAVWTERLTFDPGLQHAGNVALHLVNGLLVFEVALLLASPFAAICAAGVFLLHPLNSESVSYITGRADLLVTGWSLLAAWSALTWRDRSGWWRLALVVVALAGAAVSKEIGLIAVPLVVLTVCAWRPQPVARVVGYLCALAIGVVIGAAWWRVSGWVGMDRPADLPWLLFAAFQLGAVWDLLARSIWIAGYSIDHDALSLSVGWRVIAALATVNALALIGVAWRRLPMVAWGLAWIAICVAPRFVFATSEFLHEYQLSTAMVGVSLLLGSGLAEWGVVAAPAWRERTV